MSLPVAFNLCAKEAYQWFSFAWSTPLITNHTHIYIFYITVSYFLKHTMNTILRLMSCLGNRHLFQFFTVERKSTCTGWNLFDVFFFFLVLISWCNFDCLHFRFLLTALAFKKCNETFSAHLALDKIPVIMATVHIKFPSGHSQYCSTAQKAFSPQARIIKGHVLLIVLW